MVGALKGFEELEVWKKSIEFTHSVYMASARWPAEERFGLTQQMRRAAASVAANIAEGAERDGTKEFLRFLSIARGSLAETRTFVVLGEKLQYLDAGEALRLQQQATEIGRMLSGLAKALQSKFEGL